MHVRGGVERSREPHDSHAYYMLSTIIHPSKQHGDGSRIGGGLLSCQHFTEISAVTFTKCVASLWPRQFFSRELLSDTNELEETAAAWSQSARCPIIRRHLSQSLGLFRVALSGNAQAVPPVVSLSMSPLIMRGRERLYVMKQPHHENTNHSLIHEH